MSNGSTATASASCTWAFDPFIASISLSASASGPGTLTYQWSLFSGPAGSSFTNATSSLATLNIVNDGTYVVRLIVDNGALSAGRTLDKTITVTAGRTFTQVRAVITALGCASGGCHAVQNNPADFYDNDPDPAAGSGTPPAWVNVNTAGPETFRQRVLKRVSLADPANSLFVLNPLGLGHGGGLFFDNATPDPTDDRSDPNYITFLTWIIGGGQDN